jgi:hypothetical protein
MTTASRASETILIGYREILFIGLVAAMVSTPVLGSQTTYADQSAVCGGFAPCFTTIQEALSNAGPPPAEVLVFAGFYVETVDLDLMGSAIGQAPGDISLTTVNQFGDPTPGTATVHPGIGNSFLSEAGFVGDIRISGFHATSPNDDAIHLISISGDVEIDTVDAQFALGDGVEILVVDPNNSITVTDTTSNNNTNKGFNMNFTATGGTLTFANSQASLNGDDGVDIDAWSSGPLDVEIEIKDTRANLNGGQGMNLDTSGDITIARSTAFRNLGANITIDEAEGSVITLSHLAVGCGFQGGLEIGGQAPAGAPASVTIHDCDIEGNSDHGLGIDDDVPITVDASNNWWGSSTGPTYADNPGGTGDAIVVADQVNTTVMFAPFSISRVHGEEACTEWIFTDGFESGDTSSWSGTVP